MKKNNFEDFLTLVSETLEDADIPYVIVGGLITIIYGRPRTTMDIDIIIENPKKNFKTLEDVFQKNGFVIIENEIKTAVDENSHCSIFHTEFPYRIDLQGIYSTLDRIAFENREKRDVLGITIMLEKIEDAIIGKLVYGSQQDLEDAKSMFERQKNNINLDYLEKYASNLGLSEKLSHLINLN